MPMQQEDIRKHYEANWQSKDASAASTEHLRYSSPIEDAVLYPAYKQLIGDLKLINDETKILDVGSGSGRWIEFFTRNFRPKRIVGVDFAESSVNLLKRWYGAVPHVETRFDVCDITAEGLDLNERFDLINIANVLFHIPENDRFLRAIQNLAKHLAPGGRIVTTEYLPHQTMRTQWMLVRSRYEFEQIVNQNGLAIAEIRGFCFFSNDPMGIDGPDPKLRAQFNTVRSLTQQLLNGVNDEGSKTYLVKMMSEIESACVNFCKSHVSDINMPSQKLVVLVSR